MSINKIELQKMTADQQEIIKKLYYYVTFLPGSWDKRFSRDLYFEYKKNPDKELTENQNEWVFRLLYKYRRQIPTLYSKHSNNPLCTKKEPRQIEAKPAKGQKSPPAECVTKDGLTRINIEGYKYLLSQGPAQFNNESIFGLNVGDKIKQIGVSLKSKTNKGGETCSNRFDRFQTYLEYAGTTIMETNDHDKKALLFRVKEPEITGLDPGQYLYCVYELLHEGLHDAELVRPNMDELTIRIYRPEFEKLLL